MSPTLAACRHTSPLLSRHISSAVAVHPSSVAIRSSVARKASRSMPAAPCPAASASLTSASLSDTSSGSTVLAASAALRPQWPSKTQNIAAGVPASATSEPCRGHSAQATSSQIYSSRQPGGTSISRHVCSNTVVLLLLRVPVISKAQQAGADPSRTCPRRRWSLPVQLMMQHSSRSSSEAAATV